MNKIKLFYIISTYLKNICIDFFKHLNNKHAEKENTRVILKISDN